MELCNSWTSICSKPSHVRIKVNTIQKSVYTSTNQIRKIDEDLQIATLVKCASMQLETQRRNVLKAMIAYVATIGWKISTIQRNTRPSFAPHIQIRLSSVSMDPFVLSLTTSQSSASTCSRRWRETATFTCFISRRSGARSVTKSTRGTCACMLTIGKIIGAHLTCLSIQTRSVHVGKRRKILELTKMAANWSTGVDNATGGKNLNIIL